MAFDPLKDLNEIHKILRSDDELLEALDLKDKADVEIAKRIIRTSKWADLASNEKRLCVYFLTDRRTRNECIIESVFEIAVHAPNVQYSDAWKALTKAMKLIHRQSINKKQAIFYGQPGDLPTVDGFVCYGIQFGFYRTIN